MSFLLIGVRVFLLVSDRYLCCMDDVTPRWDIGATSSGGPGCPWAVRQGVLLGPMVMVQGAQVRVTAAAPEVSFWGQTLIPRGWANLCLGAWAMTDGSSSWLFGYILIPLPILES